MPKKKLKKLTRVEWEIVFRLRCRSKQGESLSKGERTLVESAFQEDPDRYDKMEVDVFNATVPFGSTTRKTRT